MTAKRRQAQQERIAPSPLIGRDELNLAEFPIALITDRASDEGKTIYFEDQHGRLTVTGSDKDGLPTARDADVLIAMIYITKIRNDFKDVRIYFSRYELIGLLNWHDIGQYYQRLDLSLNRWHGVSLQYDGCWWNNRLKCYTDIKMHIIDSIEIIKNETRRKTRLAGQTERPLSWFEWNKTFIESCQADNLRQINLDEYFSLKSAIAKRLYRFLGKRFWRQRDWTFDLYEIAFERVGLSRNYRDAFKIKEKLQPALAELEAIGFLRPLDRADRYRRLDRGQWTIRLARQSPALIAPQPPAEAEPPPPEPPPLEPPPLVAALMQRGMTRTTAEGLVRDYPDRIERQLEFFDWWMEKKPAKIGEPGGYLRDAIEKDYAAPKGFVAAAERQRRAAACQDQDRAAAEERRRAQEQQDRERAETKAIAAFWNALTPEEQAAHHAAALAQAPPAEVARIKLAARPVQRLEMVVLRDNYIRKLLQARGQLPPAAEA